MPNIAVKICGLTTSEDLAAAVEAGTRYVGFNFFPKSPRYVDIGQATQLASEVPFGVAKVALVVDETDLFLDELTSTVAIDMLQLHGKETPARVAEIKARYGLPVIKAIGIAGPEDVRKIDEYSRVADQLLIDAKAPKGADLPGGNGVPFDWRLLADKKYWTVPWMLAGGLTVDNVAEAIRLTGAKQVDLASAVESSPGRKDPAKMQAFVKAAQG
ncbi:MAG: phosphoribosylanthranilate isomerase [Paracoccaceae bacterium]|nr:phosphoribosylanthranilate isomerase [Paracoccaceae bacterium]MDG1736699.1 phosphoribosylanthranilate isomerase [Paracoccaceae bacterium]MDG2257529.1 phosphoribosylanthranilate isomerase [Paracoccaceae bacterium]